MISRRSSRGAAKESSSVPRLATGETKPRAALATARLPWATLFRRSAAGTRAHSHFTIPSFVLWPSEHSGRCRKKWLSFERDVQKRVRIEQRFHVYKP